jgi:hypothetical protein
VLKKESRYSGFGKIKIVYKLFENIGLAVYLFFLDSFEELHEPLDNNLFVGSLKD